MFKKTTIMAAAALLVLFAAAPAFAQDVYAPDESDGEFLDRPFTFGVKLGLAWVDVQTDEFFEEFDGRLSFLVGGFVNWRFHTYLSLQPELLYIRKGSDVIDPDLDEEGTFTLDYIEIPVLVKFHIPTESAFRPHVFAGPYAAFNLSSELEFFDETEDIEEIKGTDFGLALGAGTDWLMDWGRLTLNIRYEFSLGTIWDEPDEDLDVKNQALLFTVGYIF